jgi:hypothetical protein
MSKATRKVPLEQGVMREINELFVAPIARQCPDNMDPRLFLEQMFDVKNRDVVRFVVKRDFKMRGLFFLAPAMPVQGVGYRHIKKGTPIWARFDAREPAFVHVDLFTGHGQREQMFKLTKEEWEWTLVRLKEQERPPKKK